MDKRKEYERLLSGNLKKYYHDELGLTDYQERIARRLSREKSGAIIQRIAAYYPLKGKKILDVGSGWGEICVDAAKEGAFVSGIEPDKEELAIAKLLGETEGVSVDFRQASGEEIPFAADYFDLVICNTVLEHVNDVSKTISEMLRVTRKGGVIYLNTPNYLYPYEAHYKIFYPSLFPKFLVRIYLRARGRKAGFINHIKYITPYSLFAMLKGYDVSVKNIGLAKFKQQAAKKNIVKRNLKLVLAEIGLYRDIEIFIEKN